MHAMDQDFKVPDTGLTTLYVGRDIVADIVFVHGIQGHPRKTWATKREETSSKRRVLPKRIKGLPGFRSKETHQSVAEGNSGHEASSIFWLLHLLPNDCEDVRILTWGYESNVTRFFTGGTDQGNISDHAKNLLYALNNIRQSDMKRPLVFIAHSLGGIIVKEVLRRSNNDDDAAIQSISNQTYAVYFLGTPHRGSPYVNMGEVMRRVASAVGFDTNDANLRALDFDSLELQIIQEEFLRLWRIRSFQVRTFQESSGLAAFKGLNQKVVPDFSSSFGDTRERPQHLPGNHMTMCRFQSRDSPGYTQICGELQQTFSSLRKLSMDMVSPVLKSVYTETRDRIAGVLTQKNCQSVLTSLYFPQLHDRRNSIRLPVYNTARWLLTTTDFQDWVDGRFHCIWIKGKAGSGKSMLMKYTFTSIKPRLPAGCIAASYYCDGSGVELERSSIGLMRAILYQIFSQNEKLLEEFVVSVDNGRFIKGSHLAWQIEELMEVFAIAISLTHWTRTLIFLDALDESPRDQMRHLLEFFSTLLHDSTSAVGTKFQLCFASRHYPNLTMSRYVEISVEQNNHHDISNFVNHKLERFSNQQEAQHFITNILQQADGVFLWVDLVADLLLLSDEGGEDLNIKLSVLRQTPEGLDSLYERILRSLSPSDRRETFQMFKWVLFAARRLTPLELCFVIKFDAGSRALTFENWRRTGYFVDSGIQTERFVRNRSRGLLEVQNVHRPGPENAVTRGDTVQFIHQTVPEFLYRKGLSILEPTLDPKYMAGVNHQQIAMTCLEYLAFPHIMEASSMLLLRFILGHNFLNGVPQLSEKLKAQSDLLKSHNSYTYRPYSVEEILTPDSAAGLRLVFSELPLLGYSVSMLHHHLQLAERAGVSQVMLWDFLQVRGNQCFQIWYNFQAAFALPARHRFRVFNWKSSLHCVTALGLQSCFRAVNTDVTNHQVHFKQRDIGTALLLAVGQKAIHIATELIECGADLTFRGDHNMSPLDLASESSNTEMVKMLIEKGAKVNDVGELGTTALHYAADSGSEQVTELLLRAGALIDATNSSGETPLLRAILSNRVSVFKILMNSKANVEHQDAAQAGASKLAIRGRCAEIYAILHPNSPDLPNTTNDVNSGSGEEFIERSLTASPSPEKQAERFSAIGLLQDDLSLNVPIKASRSDHDLLQRHDNEEDSNLVNDVLEPISVKLRNPQASSLAFLETWNI